MKLQPAATVSPDHFKILTIIIALALLSTVGGWLVMDAQDMLTPALDWVLLGTTAVLTSLLVVTVTHALPQRLIELACLSYAAAISAVCAAGRRFSVAPGVRAALRRRAVRHRPLQGRQR